jgi:hypothetical protein
MTCDSIQAMLGFGIGRLLGISSLPIWGRRPEPLSLSPEAMYDMLRIRHFERMR